MYDQMGSALVRSSDAVCKCMHRHCDKDEGIILNDRVPDACFCPIETRIPPPSAKARSVVPGLLFSLQPIVCFVSLALSSTRKHGER